MFIGLFNGLGERIRTSGLLNPIQARYQAALHPDATSYILACFGPLVNIKMYRGMLTCNVWERSVILPGAAFRILLRERCSREESGIKRAVAADACFVRKTKDWRLLPGNIITSIAFAPGGEFMPGCFEGGQNAWMVGKNRRSGAR